LGRHRHLLWAWVIVISTITDAVFFGFLSVFIVTFCMVFIVFGCSTPSTFVFVFVVFFTRCSPVFVFNSSDTFYYERRA